MKPEFFQRKRTINCSGKIIGLEMPKIMGILNVSPDSFYDGGRYSDKEKMKSRIERMLTEGATFIDIGAYSSRPGAGNISAKEELERLKPAFEICLKKSAGLIASVDTFRAEIARIAVEDYGIAMINDISGGAFDKKMFDTVARLNVPYILMHIKGNPGNMQNNPEYNNVHEEIIQYFSAKMQTLNQLGVHDVILDTGFGFGKTIDHNYQILAHFQDFKIFELPLLAGISRKSMIYKYLNCTPEEALNGTTALNMIALQKGVDILRVHDVAEARQTIELYLKTLQFEK